MKTSSRTWSLSRWWDHATVYVEPCALLFWTCGTFGAEGNVERRATRRKSHQTRENWRGIRMSVSWSSTTTVISATWSIHISSAYNIQYHSELIGYFKRWRKYYRNEKLLSLIPSFRACCFDVAYYNVLLWKSRYILLHRKLRVNYEHS